eukprot:JP447032.1.p1 GENE.JP447032.1~~JP447032.1.p1  ORF type:complete len:233 (-),score=29.11 JP447032.1:17-715(-)
MQGMKGSLRTFLQLALLVAVVSTSIGLRSSRHLLLEEGCAFGNEPTPANATLDYCVNTGDDGPGNTCCHGKFKELDDFLGSLEEPREETLSRHGFLMSDVCRDTLQEVMCLLCNPFSYRYFSRLTYNDRPDRDRIDPDLLEFKMQELHGSLTLCQDFCEVLFSRCSQDAEGMTSETFCSMITSVFTNGRMGVMDIQYSDITCFTPSAAPLLRPGWLLALSLVAAAAVGAAVH